MNRGEQFQRGEFITSFQQRNLIQSPLPMNRFQNLDVDQALRLIVEGTASETGTGFYNALVKGLAATLNTNGA